MLGRLFGKPGKAGKAERAQPIAGSVQGQPSPGNALAGAIRYGVQPVPYSYAHRLGVVSSLMSPSVRGRFRTGDSSTPSNRGGTPDMGQLQTFKGAVGRLTRGARLGAQSGPSAQPGYPSTGSGGIVTMLAALDRPDVQRVGGF